MMMVAYFPWIIMIMNEQDYLAGKRHSLITIIRSCLFELGYDSIESNQFKWVVEREDVVATLRVICEDHGDNDWDERLHLSDIINKHLGDYLYDKGDKNESNNVSSTQN
jgi:hypothetical protein